jgi:hypothetical protein
MEGNEKEADKEPVDGWILPLTIEKGISGQTLLVDARDGWSLYHCLHPVY